MKRPAGTGRDGKGKIQTGSRIIPLPVVARKPCLGIGFYRHPRPPGDVIHCLTDALRREVRVSDQLGVPVPNEVLRDIASWGERGAVPR